MASGNDKKRIEELERRVDRLEKLLPRERELYRKANEAGHDGLRQLIVREVERLRDEIRQRPEQPANPSRTPA